MPSGGVPTKDFYGTGDIEKAVNRLHQTIDTFQKASEKQSRTLVGLTWAIAVLTLVMVAEVTIQILQSFHVI